MSEPPPAALERVLGCVSPSACSLSARPAPGRPALLRSPALLRGGHAALMLTPVARRGRPRRWALRQRDWPSPLVSLWILGVLAFSAYVAFFVGGRRAGRLPAGSAGAEPMSPHRPPLAPCSSTGTARSWTPRRRASRLLREHLRLFGIAFDRDAYAATYSPNWHRTYTAVGLPEDRWAEADARWVEAIPAGARAAGAGGDGSAGPPAGAAVSRGRRHQRRPRAGRRRDRAPRAGSALRRLVVRPWRLPRAQAAPRRPAAGA